MKRVLLSVGIILSLISAPAFAGLPDTGQTACYDNEAEIACPLPGEPFYGQDAQYGPNLQSFTKLDDSGNVLPDNATEWSMVRDNVTGLEWQQATAPGDYTWLEAIDYCASLNLGGHDDWRLPTVKELATLVDSSGCYPAINDDYFPGTHASYYWSSTTYADNPYGAWFVDFNYGYVYGYYKDFYGYYVRAVRAGQSGLFDNSFIDNHDGTVTDTSTGLMWQQATAPDTYTWQQALAYCEGLSLAGHSDWRLPNRNELQSLVDHSRFSPAIDTSFFPGTQASPYWSSTTLASYPYLALFVSFYGGFVSYGYKDDDYYDVRAVRAGQCGSLGDLDGDTICDNVDNCPEDYNPGQQDCDGDEIADACDLCAATPNGPDKGTCVKTVGGVIIGTGVTCTPGGTECPSGQTCQLEQGDVNGNGIGDACECYGDISGSAGNPDSKVDAFDLLKMKQEFNRTGCTPETCSADVNADGKVDSFDLLIMKVQFNKTGCP